MSVVQPGGGQKRGGAQQGGQRPGPPGGRPPAQKRPPGKQQGNRTSQSGSRNAQDGAQTRTQPQTRGVPKQKPTQRTGTQRTGAQKAGQRPGPQQKGRRNIPVQAAPPRRFNPTVLTIAAVGVVVVIVVALVIVKVTGSNSNSNAIAPVNTPAPPAVMAKVTGVSASVMDAVGVPSTSNVAAPSVVKNQPAYTRNGKPGGFAVLAEFCPYCGAMRWPLLVSLSQFGTFSGVKVTTSSPWDVYPATPTFSFLGATYQSPYIDFQLTENESNDTGANGAGRHVITPLSAQETRLDAKYSHQLGLTAEGYPFIDLGNKVFVTSPLYNPQNLAGLDHQTIASDLSDSTSPVTQAIVGAANYLTAAICSADGQQPASVCSISAVTKAAHALGIG